MSVWQKLVAERYRLLRQIGSGGMGRVWLARDEMLRRDVAVKEVVFPDGLTDSERDELCQRTLREARAAGRLNHPNVVGVYDVVQEDDRPWIVMELVRARSLYQVLKQDGPLPPRQVAEIGLCLLDALRAAHAAGVLHRDVKPGNVLLADDGRVVLTDFGLATFEGSDGTVTRPGLVLGSAQYISPERARDGTSGPESDLWSLGATLYAAVEGRSPYARETSMATLTALATEPPTPPRHAGALKPVLLALLRRNPRARLTAAEAERALRKILGGEGRARAKGASPPPEREPAAEPEALPQRQPGTQLRSEPRALITAGAGAGPAGPVHLHTVTEETMQHVARRARWPWLVGAVAVTLVASTAVVAFEFRPTSPGGAGVPSSTLTPSSPPARTAAMGVQACTVAPTQEQPVPPGGTAAPGEFGAPSQWVYFRDPSGFRLVVPQAFRMSRLGPLLCFRDPAGSRAIAVYQLGALDGDLVDLLQQAESPWRNAANLEDYQKLSLRKVPYQDAADLEYTYRGPDGLVMRGVNRWVRMGGQVYQLSWLTTSYSWTAELELLNALEPSFKVDL